MRSKIISPHHKKIIISLGKKWNKTIIILSSVWERKREKNIEEFLYWILFRQIVKWFVLSCSFLSMYTFLYSAYFIEIPTEVHEHTDNTRSHTFFHSLLSPPFSSSFSSSSPSITHFYPVSHYTGRYKIHTANKNRQNHKSNCLDIRSFSENSAGARKLCITQSVRVSLLVGYLKFHWFTRNYWFFCP